MRAVLFDAGNTLLELDYPWLSELARSLGASAGPEEIGVAGARLLRQNSLRYGMTPSPQDAGAVFRSSFRAIGEAIGLSDDAAMAFAQVAQQEDRNDPRGLWRCLSPGVAATLAALRERDLRLGVISNADGNAEQHLVLAGLRDWFEVVVDSWIVGVQKPATRIFAIALEHLGLAAEDAIYVGDLLEVDVTGARAAGIRPLLYDRFDAYADIREGRIRALHQILEIGQGR